MRVVLERARGEVIPERAQVVLGTMREAGFVTDREITTAMSQAPTRAKSYWSGAEHYAADLVMDQVPKLVGDITEDLVVETTIDLDLENEGVIVTRHGKGSFVADVNGLAGELQEGKLEEHLDAAAALGQQLGLTEEDLAARLRRAIRNVDKK